MRHIIQLSFLLIFFVIAVANAEQNTIIELTRDNPSTLISTNSRGYSICGIRLGMSRAEAQKILDGLDFLIGVKDGGNPDTRIYVYYRNSDGSRGKSIFYLIWEPDEKRLGRIAIYEDFSKYLTENFRRLLTFEALDDSSSFKKSFIGKSNRSKVTLDIPRINLKETTYFYNKIGLEIIHVRTSEKEYVILAIAERPSR